MLILVNFLYNNFKGGDRVVVEKRKYKRVKFDCEILYPTVIYNNEKRLFSDNCKLYAVDISEAGIALKSNFFIPKDAFITFFLRIEDYLPFRALVKVRWNKNSNGYFFCGGEFIALNLEDIHKIRTYITKHINDMEV